MYKRYQYIPSSRFKSINMICDHILKEFSQDAFKIEISLSLFKI